eukprot:31032-Pelagococcus_subviridis.AAC.34
MSAIATATSVHRNVAPRETCPRGKEDDRRERSSSSSPGGGRSASVRASARVASSSSSRFAILRLRRLRVVLARMDFLALIVSVRGRRALRTGDARRGVEGG